MIIKAYLDNEQISTTNTKVAINRTITTTSTTNLNTTVIKATREKKNQQAEESTSTQTTTQTTPNNQIKINKQTAPPSPIEKPPTTVQCPVCNLSILKNAVNSLN